MSSDNLSGELGRWEVAHYHDMEYVCEDCGKTETFDGRPVKKRSPFGDDEDGCAIHMMNLQNREAYWNGEIEPDEVVSLV